MEMMILFVLLFVHVFVRAELGITHVLIRHSQVQIKEISINQQKLLFCFIFFIIWSSEFSLRIKNLDFHHLTDSPIKLLRLFCRSLAIPILGGGDELMTWFWPCSPSLGPVIIPQTCGVLLRSFGEYEIESSPLATKQINPSSQPVLMYESVFPSSEILLCEWCISLRLCFIRQTGIFYLRIMILCCTEGPKVSAYLRWLCTVAQCRQRGALKRRLHGVTSERLLAETGRQTSSNSGGSGLCSVWVMLG